MKPLVSVVMPVYNAGEYLEITIRSILNQEFREFEFLIINDGSTDRSEEIIRSFSDPRIRYLRNEENRGLIYSLNLGVGEAKGDYVARIDADDVADKERLKIQVQFLHDHPEIVLCGSFYKIIDKLGAAQSKVDLPTLDKDIRTYLLFGNCFCHSSVMIRTNILQALGYSRDYNLCEDYDLWFRVKAKYRVANLPYYHTLYRVHGENISSRKRDEMLKCVKAIHGRGLKQLGIPYTEEELILHNALLGFDHVRCMQFSQTDIFSWLKKFADRVSVAANLNRRLAMKVFIRRWATVCFNAGKYDLILNNPLFKSMGLFYLQCVFEKFIDRSLGRNRGLDL